MHGKKRPILTPEKNIHISNIENFSLAKWNLETHHHRGDKTQQNARWSAWLMIPSPI